MDLGIKDKTALVFGASSGIGKGIAAALIQEGVRTTIASRSIEKLKATMQEIGAEGIFPCDLSDPESRMALFSEFSDRNPVDILVINTGGPPTGSFLDVSTEQWTEQFQNLWLITIEVMQFFLRMMKKKEWGRIILVTSMSAKEPIKNLTISNGFRAGLSNLCKSVAVEVAGKNITVNAILPGYIQTQRMIDLGRDLNKVGSTIPVQRLGTTAELGSIACFLASQQAGYITGQSIVIDGGYLKGF